MAENHDWKIKRKYYTLIKNGIKTLEVKVGYPYIKRVREGDTITFAEYSDVRFEVIRITRYESLQDMLNSENSYKAIPGVTKYEALNLYQKTYPKEKRSSRNLCVWTEKTAFILKFQAFSEPPSPIKASSKILLSFWGCFILI